MINLRSKSIFSYLLVQEDNILHLFRDKDEITTTNKSTKICLAPLYRLILLLDSSDMQFAPFALANGLWLCVTVQQHESLLGFSEGKSESRSAVTMEHKDIANEISTL